jgi:hypothetical protein
MRQIRRLIAPGLRLLWQVARQQVRAIRLEHQSVRRNLAHQWEQVRAAPLVADPAGDADGKVHLQVRQQLLSRAGEAMRHRAGESFAVLAQNRNEILVRIALVEKDGLANVRGQLELAMESFLLAWPG